MLNESSTWKALSDAAGIVAAHGHRELSEKLIGFAEALDEKRSTPTKLEDFEVNHISIMTTGHPITVVSLAFARALIAAHEALSQREAQGPVVICHKNGHKQWLKPLNYANGPVSLYTAPPSREMPEE